MGTITATPEIEAALEELDAISDGLACALDLLPSCTTEYKVFEELSGRLVKLYERLDDALPESV